MEPKDTMPTPKYSSRIKMTSAPISAIPQTPSSPEEKPQEAVTATLESGAKCNRKNRPSSALMKDPRHMQSKAVKYKKAPGAPRRFRPAFIFFSAKKHKELRALMGVKAAGETVAKVSKMISQMWKSLGPEERAKWEAMAHNDKARYEMEKSSYSGPWRVLKQRRPKCGTAPKRPMSAYLAFANSRRADAKLARPNASNGELSRFLAAMWREAPEALRQAYITEERGQMKKYKAAMEEWRAQSQEENFDEECQLHLKPRFKSNQPTVDWSRSGTTLSSGNVLENLRREETSFHHQTELLTSNNNWSSTCLTQPSAFHASGSDVSCHLSEAQPIWNELRPIHFEASLEEQKPSGLGRGESNMLDDLPIDHATMQTNVHLWRQGQPGMVSTVAAAFRCQAAAGPIFGNRSTPNHSNVFSYQAFAFGSSPGERGQNNVEINELTVLPVTQPQLPLNACHGALKQHQNAGVEVFPGAASAFIADHGHQLKFPTPNIQDQITCLPASTPTRPYAPVAGPCDDYPTCALDATVNPFRNNRVLIAASDAASRTVVAGGDHSCRPWTHPGHGPAEQPLYYRPPPPPQFLAGLNCYRFDVSTVGQGRPPPDSTSSRLDHHFSAGWC